MIQVNCICKSFETVSVLRDVSFDVGPGEIVCLLGPSGCGKTTLLYIIAGLEQADSGQVLIEGRSIANVPVHQRGFGLMFQDYALFPHKNVYANVAFGLRMAGMAHATQDSRVKDMLSLVGLAGFERRNVNQLSGGEQQRVALARSLAPQPRLLMLDEPLGSLDRALRERLMNELRDVLKTLGQTALYVTHDQQEAFAVADRVVIMSGGRVLQVGTPFDVYRQPANVDVARFLGMNNVLPGRVVAAAQRVRVQTTLASLGELEVTPGSACPSQPGADVLVLIRPEAATLGPVDGPYGEVAVTLISRSFRGSFQQIVAQASGGEAWAFNIEADTLLPPPGSLIHLKLRYGAMTCLPSASATKIMLMRGGC